jgi:predicted nucleotidyltransferase
MEQGIVSQDDSTPPTTFPEINRLIEKILTELKSILENRLVGLYLEGSLVLGDFDPMTSDIDPLAAISQDLDEQEFETLRRMHADLVEQYPEWDNRIEVCYISVEALKSVKSRASQIVNISPGEPFHRTETRPEWVMNWYLTREKSETLFGPSPKSLIEPVSREEYIQSVKAHARSWGQKDKMAGQTPKLKTGRFKSPLPLAGVRVSNPVTYRLISSPGWLSTGFPGRRWRNPER